MATKNLNSVSPLRFMKLKPNRERVIASARAKKLPSEFPVNRLSSTLHPDKQHFIISDIKV